MYVSPIEAKRLKGKKKTSDKASLLDQILKIKDSNVAASTKSWTQFCRFLNGTLVYFNKLHRNYLSRSLYIEALILVSVRGMSSLVWNLVV